MESTSACCLTFFFSFFPPLNLEDENQTQKNAKTAQRSRPVRGPRRGPREPRRGDRPRLPRHEARAVSVFLVFHVFLLCLSSLSLSLSLSTPFPFPTAFSRSSSFTQTTPQPPPHPVHRDVALQDARALGAEGQRRGARFDPFLLGVGVRLHRGGGGGGSSCERRRRRQQRRRRRRRWRRRRRQQQPRCPPRPRSSHRRRGIVARPLGALGLRRHEGVGGAAARRRGVGEQERSGKSEISLPRSRRCACLRFRGRSGTKMLT